MGLSVAVRNGLLDHYFGKNSLTPPTDIYIALVKSNGEEPVGNGYARVQTDSDDWNSASAGVIDNSVKIIFPQPTGTWGTITHVKLFDAASGGNELGVSALPYSRDVTAINPPPEFAIGNLRTLIL